jgi:hypothetical protein
LEAMDSTLIATREDIEAVEIASVKMKELL